MVSRRLPPMAPLLLALAGVLGAYEPLRADVPQPPSEVRVDPATFDIAAIQAAYRKALARWASGATSEAVAELQDLESGVVGVDGSGIDRLFKAEMKSVRELEKQQSESLLPVLVLHHDSYAAYRESGNSYLAVHARNMIQSVAQVYSEHSANEGKASTAMVLVSLGSYVQEGSLTGFAANLYTRALELDPDNEVALLGLGALFEKAGKYETAADYLGRLLKAHPRQQEGRLRYALCLARGGKADEAQRQLEALVAAGDAPDWILNLGYQELASLYAGKGSYDRAQELLRRALARFPGDARLHVQLAAMLERSGRPGAALEAAEKVHTLKLDRGESPRYRYSRWAPDALIALRAALHETSDSRLGLLAQALGTAPGKEG